MPGFDPITFTFNENSNHGQETLLEVMGSNPGYLLKFFYFIWIHKKTKMKIFSLVSRRAPTQMKMASVELRLDWLAGDPLFLQSWKREEFYDCFPLKYDNLVE